jgi:hypothetical protein
MTQVVTHHNIPSILTETALYHLATPHEYSTEDIPEAWRDFQKSGFYTTPWEGGWWRIGDAVEYCLTASMAVLDVTARYREEMLLSKYRLAQANIQRFEMEGPFGWAFPPGQRDSFALAELLDKFELLGVEVYRATEAFQAGGRALPEGTLVVPTSQPFGGFVKTLLERQEYPDLRTKTHLWQGIPRRVEVESGPLRPYDVAGWTLPLQMGLEAVELDGPASRLALEEAGRFVPYRVQDGRAWLLDPSDGASWRAVNLLLDRGVEVEVERGGAGRFLLPPNNDEALSDVIREIGWTPRYTSPSGDALPATGPLDPFRVAVYRPWQGSMDEGWLRWILEHYDFDPAELRNDRVRAGDLRVDFDAIVIPSLRAGAIVEGNREGSVPPEYVGGIGAEGVEALKAFAREGGTLFFHDASTQFAIQEFGLPIQVVSQEATRAGFYSAGSILRFSWAQDTPLTRGMDPQGVIFATSRGSLFRISGEGADPVGALRPLGSFPEDGSLLLSGYLEGEEAIAGAIPAVEVGYGEGRLVLVGFSLHNRAQMVANFKLLFNAIASG